MVILGLTDRSGWASPWLRSGFAGSAFPFTMPMPGASFVAMTRDDQGRCAMFPGVISNDAIDRAKLGRRVFGDEAALRRLESILHPRVQLVATRFLRRSAGERRPLVALDIPLLFETGGERRCDAVVVVSAPGFVQAARVLHRPGMTATPGGNSGAPDAGCRQTATG
jgi:hypothetical protein